MLYHVRSPINPSYGGLIGLKDLKPLKKQLEKDISIQPWKSPNTPNTPRYSGHPVVYPWLPTPVKRSESWASTFFRLEVTEIAKKWTNHDNLDFPTCIHLFRISIDFPLISFDLSRARLSWSPCHEGSVHHGYVHAMGLGLRVAFLENIAKKMGELRLLRLLAVWIMAVQIVGMGMTSCWTSKVQLSLSFDWYSLVTVSLPLTFSQAPPKSSQTKVLWPRDESVQLGSWQSPSPWSPWLWPSRLSWLWLWLWPLWARSTSPATRNIQKLALHMGYMMVYGIPEFQIMFSGEHWYPKKLPWFRRCKHRNHHLWHIFQPPQPLKQPPHLAHSPLSTAWWHQRHQSPLSPAVGKAASGHFPTAFLLWFLSWLRF